MDFFENSLFKDFETNVEFLQEFHTCLLQDLSREEIAKKLNLNRYRMKKVMGYFIRKNRIPRSYGKARKEEKRKLVNYHLWFDRLLEELLQGNTLTDVEHKYHASWRILRDTRDMMIENGKWDKRLERINSLDFIRYWEEGLTLREMNRRGLACRKKLREVRDALLKLGLIQPR